MPETNTIQGTIRIVGTVHGALNTIVSLYDDPDNWSFKQFVTEQELQTYAQEFHLALIKE